MAEGICKLCLKTAPLLDSHYLPKRLYSMNRESSLKNPNPVTLAHGQAKQVSDQLKGYTFCETCEDRFSKNGEKWVLANVARGYREDCSLQEALIPNSPYYGNDNLNVYAGSEITTINLQQLIFFGMSIFWRGAARTWKSSTGAIAPPVDLRESFEPIRQFLLGGPFPGNVYIVILIHNSKPVPNAIVPVQQGSNEYGEYYWFYANGLGFQLYLGDAVPSAIRSVCAVHNPRRPVVVDRGFGRMVNEFLRHQLENSQQSESVADLMQAHKQHETGEPSEAK